MHIDWQALASVFGVSLLSTVALVGLFTLGIVALSKRESASVSGGSATLAVTGAYACFAACAAAVAYGIFIIVS
ncbi:MULTISPECIES: hypothetical protein [Streptomyces]|uniref:Secreted protein n=1 Tax=Streptomyces dengpaensis TaxID=2049881 RepID=A0ABM6SXZ3_9ACTN|nr:MULTISPECIES: hypothetical protein [Streptomyces]AVH59470.1 hypothetical protein C4B68_31145 [Streptomyces dengpaensis]PIB05828.1 hypothetical protein B1C81_27425 [Streptomyces sp. HG99]